MTSSEKFDMERDFAEGVYLSEARTPIPHFTHCLYVYTVYLFTQRRGSGRVELDGRRATEESTDYKAGLKIPKYLNVRKKFATSSL
jgi:hypothetical protein